MPLSSGTKAQNEDGVPLAYPDETTIEAVRASMAVAAAAAVPAPRLTIVISDEPHSSALLTATTNMGTAPLSPVPWLALGHCRPSRGVCQRNCRLP